MYELGEIKKYKTQNFEVVIDAVEEIQPDLSWDDTGETAAKINSGEWVIFCARVRVFYKGQEVGSDYLGNCIYESYESFNQPRSYFQDMIRRAIEEARKYFEAFQLPYIRGVTY